MTELIRYEAARRALAEAVAFDEVMSIMNVAKQAELYARQASDNELIEKATEIRVRAQRKAGEMLKLSKERGERADGSGSINQHNRASHADTPTLSQIGVTPMQSSRWQSLASMSDEHFETTVATAKATAGEVTTAFMLREAEKARPKGRPITGKKADELRAKLQAAEQDTEIQACAKRLIALLKQQDSVTAQELQVLGEVADAIAAKRHN